MATKDKLATFKINSDEWDRFKQLAESSNTTASGALMGFVRQCLEAGEISGAPQENLDDDIDTRIDSHLEKALTPIKLEMEGAIAALRGEMAEVKKP